MKRANHIFEQLVSDGNLRLALVDVNASHRWLPKHRPNKTVAWVEQDMDARVSELREIIFQVVYHKRQLSKPKKKQRYDKSAGKWRIINEPKLWPDEYIHHALVQVLQPTMMRGMDRHCCGSIRKRGIHYGKKKIEKWMKTDPKGTKYTEELDIHHFYDSIDTKYVMLRLRMLFKDWRVLKLCEEVLRYGVLIGLYTSQWFANTLLQPLDQLIRDSGLCRHYIRYMDNFTIFGSNKRKLRRLRGLIEKWLASIRLSLKSNWQVFPTSARMPCALGYRFGRGYTLLKKRNLFRLKRKLNEYYRRKRKHRKISTRMATGLLSRLGQLKHCNHKNVYEIIYHGKVQRDLKSVVRNDMRRERLTWSIFLEQTATTV